MGRNTANFLGFAAIVYVATSSIVCRTHVELLQTEDRG
jgi:hypothetical protein